MDVTNKDLANMDAAKTRNVVNRTDAAETQNGMARKEFLRTAGSVALFAFLGISLKSCNVTSSNDDEPPENDDEAITIEGNIVRLNLDAVSLAGLRQAGGWMVIARASLIVVNIDGDLIRAFTDVCPHAGCRDSWRYESSRFVCTCHNSVFENDGSLVSGPAQSNLPEFEVQREGNLLTIIK